jgi:hypothetical protein
MQKKVIFFLLSIILFFIALILFLSYIIFSGGKVNDNEKNFYSPQFKGPPQGAIPYVKGPTSPPPFFEKK